MLVGPSFFFPKPSLIFTVKSEFFFFFELRGKGTPKQCPPDVIEEMTKSTDHVLQGYRNRGA